VQLLPYLGHSTVYHSINLSLIFRHRANFTVSSMSLGVFLCPSDIRPIADPDGVTNFVGSEGSGRWPGGFDAICDGMAYADGFFAGSLPISPSSIVDGLSHTSAFCEKIHGGRIDPETLQNTKHPSPIYEYHMFPSSQTQNELMRMCENLAPPILPWQSGTPWLAPVSTTYTHLFVPNKPSCWGGNMGRGFSPVTASSRHVKGVNLLFADGHVRFLSENVDLEVGVRPVVELAPKTQINSNPFCPH
jgi:prepilin-type processing-associated H-X9-DG protein